MQEVTTGMRENGNNNMEYRKKWKENKTLGSEGCDNIDTLYNNEKLLLLKIQRAICKYNITIEIVFFVKSTLFHS